VGGIAAAFGRRLPALANLARRPTASAIAVACLASEAMVFATAYGPVQIALLAVAFCLIACGTDLFGVLGAATSRMLGEMTYGICLLHGIVLFVVFHFLLGRESSAELSAFEHWSVVLALVPALIALCCAALVIVERPGMRAVPRVTSLVRRKWSAVAGSGAGSRTR
jgi:peptidoglycan/LPS O-acetylase OafA/YrhL